MILIADDNENDLLMIERTLKAAGIKNQITTVNDGREVIAYFQGKNKYADRTKYPIPTVLFLDLKMPQIGGFGVLEWLKDAQPTKDLLTIVLSGFGEIENIRRGYKLGARSFLTKPLRSQDMLNLIQGFSSYPYWQVENPKVRNFLSPGS